MEYAGRHRPVKLKSACERIAGCSGCSGSPVRGPGDEPSGRLGFNRFSGCEGYMTCENGSRLLRFRIHRRRRGGVNFARAMPAGHRAKRPSPGRCATTLSRNGRGANKAGLKKNLAPRGERLAAQQPGEGTAKRRTHPMIIKRALRLQQGIQRHGDRRLSALSVSKRKEI